MSIEEKAKRMAVLVAKIDEVERARKQVAKEFRDEVTALWKELEAISGDVESGQLSLGEGSTLTGPDGKKIETEGELAEAVAGAVGRTTGRKRKKS